ncbi:MAG: P-loop NTPase [Sporolactobacillus sp.]|jgi:flagellar biosynthesis protein FlhG|nr:P-loop NTPase [Sporolactobacillus sp.]
MSSDQAEKLRKLALRKQHRRKRAQIVAVISGKGGVGKSVFCANFSIALRALNKSVLIIDLDVGMANIGCLFGREAPYSLVDCIHDHLELEDVVIRGPNEVFYISGGNRLNQLFHFNQANLQVVLEQIEALRSRFDVILLDFGAGVSENLIYFMLAVDRIVLVTTPEPTAITDGYSALKLLLAANPSLDISCVVNMVESSREGQATWRRLSAAAKKFLGADMRRLTALHRDRFVPRSVKCRMPCLLCYPNARYSMEMRLLAASFLVDNSSVPLVRPSFTEQVKNYFSRFRRRSG